MPKSMPPGRCVSLRPETVVPSAVPAKRSTAAGRAATPGHATAPTKRSAHSPGAGVDPIRRWRVPRALRVGIGGPVGSGKTALVAALCRAFADELRLGGGDQRHLHDRGRRLPPARRAAGQRIRAVETGCCPHTAIRDDIGANLDAVEELAAALGPLDLVLVETGGDNLTATFSRGLVDRQIFVVDVAGGDKVPRKGGPGVTAADLLVINKTDLAPMVGADLAVMDRDARARRGDLPTLFLSIVGGPHGNVGRGLDPRAGAARRPAPTAVPVGPSLSASARSTGRPGGRPGRYALVELHGETPLLLRTRPRPTVVSPLCTSSAGRPGRSPGTICAWRSRSGRARPSGCTASLRRSPYRAARVPSPGRRFAEGGAAGATLHWLPEQLVAAAGCAHARVPDRAGRRREPAVARRADLRPVRRVFPATSGSPPPSGTPAARCTRTVQALGPAAPGWSGAAVLGGGRAGGSAPSSSSDPAWVTGGPPAPTVLGPGAALMPLAGPGLLATAVGTDMRRVRAALDPRCEPTFPTSSQPAGRGHSSDQGRWNEVRSTGRNDHGPAPNTMLATTRRPRSVRRDCRSVPAASADCPAPRPAAKYSVRRRCRQPLRVRGLPAATVSSSGASELFSPSRSSRNASVRSWEIRDSVTPSRAATSLSGCSCRKDSVTTRRSRSGRAWMAWCR